MAGRGEVIIDPDDIDVVVFDMDGVVTDTATTHSRAWGRLFDEFLERRAEATGQPFEPFSNDDYLAHVDGKPRYDGVRDFLASRGITLPEGGPDDPDDAETVQGLGNRKNTFFTREIEQGGVVRYESTIDLIHALHNAGIKAALISSSRNAVPVLTAASALELFDARVDGVDAEQRGITGKPAPDVFVTAASDCGATPDRAVVVEDAVSGVQAGRAGDFALVIGVDRGGNAEALAANGADVVVDDLDKVVVG
jgi:beta-phosphoglucomutase family hydrolase